MKILFSYPPLGANKGYPALGQNRQFQYLTEPTCIYPVIPAVAATALRDEGHEVLWNDCPAEGIDLGGFHALLAREQPDLIVFETKTPVVQEHWRLIGDIKKRIRPDAPPRIVLIGDHVTAEPEESLHQCPVDFILTGGDYDFQLVALCRHLAAEPPRDGSVDRAPLPAGTWYRDERKAVTTGPFSLAHDLDAAPFIDRDLTKWSLYAHRNGNYKRRPGTYIMSGRDCWWGRCRFCSWTQLYPTFRVRSPENVLNEIGAILDRYPVREIMDDTGTFPHGDWLRAFCAGVMERGYHKRVGFDCNFRFDAAGADDYRLMRRAGFRFLLFGLESGNDETLQRLDKGLTVQQIEESCRQARRAGLYPHLTVMFGYPWEDYEQARQTARFARHLLRKGYACTVQATMVMPYPGTALYETCLENNWLTTSNWADFDMSRPIMKVPFPAPELHKLVRGVYRIAFDPAFLARRIGGIRDWDDVRLFLRSARRVIGHLKDFTRRP